MDRNLSPVEIKELHKCLIELTKVFRDVCDENGIWYSLAFGTMLGAVREKNIIGWDTDVDVFVLHKDLDRIRDAFSKINLQGIEYRNHNTAPRCLSSHDNLIFTKSDVFPDIHLDIYPIVGAPATKEEQDKVTWRWNYVDRIVRSKYVDIRHCLPKNRILVAGAKIIDYCIPDTILRNNIKMRETKYNMEETGYWLTLANYGAGRSCFPVSFLEETEEKELNGEKFKVMKEWHKFLTIVYGDYMTPKKY